VTPAGLADAVLSTARLTLATRGLDPSVLPATTTVRPHGGEFASALALQVAGRVGLAPRELASALAEGLARVPGIEAVTVAGPGFLNIRIADIRIDAVRLPAVVLPAVALRAVVARVRTPRGDADELRYARLRDPGEPDVERFTRHNDDNPAYRVLYAHARAASTLRQAADLGIAPDENAAPVDDALAALLAAVPPGAEPRRLTRYLERVAGAYDRFSAGARTDLTPERLRLVEAVRAALANGLDALGIAAPERM
jgi:arginyl-tRNA synthetase